MKTRSDSVGWEKAPTAFLQAVVVAVGAAALAFLLWEPHLEGRNVGATPFQIYFKDPFLAFAYLASTPFFVALYQAFKALGRVGRGEAFSRATVQSVKTIKYCALATIGFAAAGVLVIVLTSGEDDRAGGVAMGLLVATGSAVAAASAAALERVLGAGTASAAK